MVVVVLGLMLILLATSLEIFAALGICGLAGLFLFLHQPSFILTRMSWGITYSFILTAIPLFVFMGNIFLNSGVSRGMFYGLTKWVGHLPGGLASAVVAGCAIFAAISGSSPATAATLGAVSLPEMEKRGYKTKLTYGAVAAGGTLGILIPPSITLIIYGAWVEVSVVDLFKAGLIPGIVLAALYIIMITIRVKFQPSLAPKVPAAPWRERLLAIGGIAPWFIIILVVLGTILFGIVTPTEGASIGVICALLTALVYRTLSFDIVKKSALSTVEITSMILVIVCTSKLVAYIFHYLQVPQLVLGPLLSMNLPDYGVIGLIFLMYLFLGCFFNPLAMLVLTMPFVLPILNELGINLVWFGVFFVICAEAAQITPPVGTNLYILMSLDKRATLGEVFKSCVPFLVMMVLMVALLVAFPQIALWLPSL